MVIDRQDTSDSSTSNANEVIADKLHDWLQQLGKMPTTTASSSSSSSSHAAGGLRSPKTASTAPASSTTTTASTSTSAANNKPNSSTSSSSGGVGSRKTSNSPNNNTRSNNVILMTQQSDLVKQLITFFMENYLDQDSMESILSELIALHQRGGGCRVFVLQFLPAVIHVYIVALAYRRLDTLDLLQAFILSVYTEEIIERVDTNNKRSSEQFGIGQLTFSKSRGGNSTPDSQKLSAGSGGGKQRIQNVSTYRRKVETVRIPSLAIPSIYHDPSTLNQSSVVNDATLNRLSAPSPSFINPTGEDSGFNSGVSSGHPVIHIGPFPSITEMRPENRYLVLSRLIKSVNDHLSEFHVDSLRSLCKLASAVARSGFHFPELLTGIYFAIFNGCEVIGLRALDDIHQRACFQLFADVLLVTNAIINSLKENPSGTPAEGPMGIKVTLSNSFADPSSPPDTHRRSSITPRRPIVTNKSLRIKRMPEDIPVVQDDQHPASPPSARKKVLSSIAEVAGKIKEKDWGGKVVDHNKEDSSKNNDNEEIGERSPLMEGVAASNNPPDHHGEHGDSTGGSSSKIGVKLHKVTKPSDVFRALKPNKHKHDKDKHLSKVDEGSSVDRDRESSDAIELDDIFLDPNAPALNNPIYSGSSSPIVLQQSQKHNGRQDRSDSTTSTSGGNNNHGGGFLHPHLQPQQTQSQQNLRPSSALNIGNEEVVNRTHSERNVSAGKKSEFAAAEDGFPVADTDFDVKGAMQDKLSLQQENDTATTRRSAAAHQKGDIEGMAEENSRQQQSLRKYSSDNNSSSDTNTGNYMTPHERTPEQTISDEGDNTNEGAAAAVGAAVTAERNPLLDSFSSKNIINSIHQPTSSHLVTADASNGQPNHQKSSHFTTRHARMIRGNRTSSSDGGDPEPPIRHADSSDYLSDPEQEQQLSDTIKETEELNLKQTELSTPTPHSVAAANTHF